MDQLVRFLFKHERAVFTNGQFSFDIRPSLVLFIVGALLVGALIYFIYLRPRTRLAPMKLTGLIVLRVSLLALLTFLLLRPVVVVPSVIPRSTYVAVLADDSRSMQLTDEADQRSRLEAIRSTLAADGSFLRRLEDKFKANLYGFSSELKKLPNAGELSGEGSSTDIAGALQEAVKSSAGMPLSAIVIVTDGAANTPRDLAAQLRDLRSRNLPVYTVGVGSPKRFKDAELVRVNLPRRVLVGSSINVEALVRLSGYEGAKVLLSVREDGRTIKTQEFSLRGGEAQTVTLELTPNTAGSHRYTFSMTPLEGELTLENNTQESLVEVIEGPLRVLYIEGEPRWEHGKLRAALTRNEKNVVLVSMLRSGNNKFYRQGVEGEGELASGFPKTDEELFAYQGFILGSVEAGFFTPEQLKNIEAFVGRRGGGLLAIGGRYAFDGGKYANTPIADLLPLYLDDRVEQRPENNVPNYKAVLTARGRTHAITRLNEDRALSQKVWEQLPLISVPEVLGAIKPGATLLLEAHRNGSNTAVPLLAEERYGRGRTLAFTASDTWRWLMKMDSKSNAHETFWRQMLRYLVSTSPEQIEIAAEHDVYAVNDIIRIVADIRDKKYEPLKEARATARITKPSGAFAIVPLRFTTRDEANVFTGEFTPDEIGLHHVELNASNKNANLGSAQSKFLVSELNREFYDATQNVELLKRIANETGGKYYSLDEASNLIDDLTYRQSDNSERVVKELWDMPINFLLLVGLVSAEWFLRKREGLA